MAASLTVKANGVSARFDPIWLDDVNFDMIDLPLFEICERIARDLAPE
jgi:hypothetical protein